MVDINELFNDFNALMQEKLGKDTSKMSQEERLAIASMLKAQSDDVTGVLKQKDSIRDVVPMDEDNQAELRLGDCTLLIQEIPNKSVDLIMTDLPYGITDAKWDSKIDINFLMKEFKRIIKPKGNIILTASREFSIEVLGEYEYKQEFKGYNRSYFEYDRAKILHKHHITDSKNPTQKPIDLLRDLIMIFSNPNDLVLDITMGTGSTGVASLLSGRRFLGFDLDSEFFDIASGRMVMLLELLGQGVELDEDHYFWHYL